jgi:hypothetical protein
LTGDCNDAVASIHTGATETCNDIDDDCNGKKDDNVSFQSYLPDCDGDGYGDDSATPVVDCAPPAAAPTCANGSGVWVTLTGDCDDTAPAVHTGVSEICNGVDDDCNGEKDDGLQTAGYLPDCDNDNHGDDSATPIVDCAAPATAPTCNTGNGVWVTLAGDCNDSAASVHSDASETCNGVDDDCDDETDEELPTAGYLPDCDVDGYGDKTATPIVGCGPPSTPPACAGGVWAVPTGDCADGDPTRNPGKIEACNAVDDDCDDLVDDINDGVVICTAGQTGSSCTNDCGVSGTADCAADCLGFDACSSTEHEICNYCDDNESGNFNEEKVMSTYDQADRFGCGSGSTFGVASCDTAPGGGSKFILEATLLDGTGNDQAGAIWTDPTNWSTGWEPVEVDVILQVRGVPTGSGFEVPLGGWAIAFSTDGSVGVGTPENNGVPSGHAAKWYWAAYYCMNNNPPAADDVVRFSGFRAQGTGQDWSCSQGKGLIGGSTGFSGGTSWMEQRMRVRYTPDDPSTSPDNEEEIKVWAWGPNGGNESSYTYLPDDGNDPSPNNEIPVGSNLRIGITAGTFTDTGFDGPPAGSVFGMPIEAKVQLWRFEPPDGPGDDPVYDLEEATVSRQALCPP